MAQRVNPLFRHFVQQFPQGRMMGEWNIQPPSQGNSRLTEQPPSQGNSRLTEEEQKMAVEKLKKKVYNPPRKVKANIYYRPNINNIKTWKEDKEDDHSEGCVICLDNFLPYQEVIATPCKHIFHEECIFPWVKSQGQCPVCRFTLFEQRRGSTVPQTNNNNNNAVGGDLIQLVWLMEEALGLWGNVPQ
ncbi:PREDICTED: E3 ubiquitin-protein ligase RING1-like [Nelumbo nucifera]|nr:PREDICTED: E3 ubiquitin-protein ligase RING1-like [Nelumbo nucifera]